MKNKPLEDSTFAFDNTYFRELEGFYAPARPDRVPSPELLCLNEALAKELVRDGATLDPGYAAEVFSGNRLPEGAFPLAQAYAGHQFGGFSPQLGDGRALLLGEVVDRSGRRRDIQLKGSGRTPFSRGGDGKAAVGPVLREYLIGEAMHALGIPTTRALAAVSTGETVRREAALPGAVLTRVAASHIRIGTFQFFAARRDAHRVQLLADYAIARHYPELIGADDKYLRFMEAVSKAQASLVAHWMHVGFIHGVMNTDNMAISGETIDYGPCAYMDAYDPKTVFSSIDAHGRYAYGNQPAIAEWNLGRLAETLMALVSTDEEEAAAQLTDVVSGFSGHYARRWLSGMCAKLGLAEPEDGDLALVQGLLSAMEEQRADFTLVFRRLAGVLRGDLETVRGLFADPSKFDGWLVEWQSRIGRDVMPSEERARAMDRVNPMYIPRNHNVEEALTAATESNDLGPFKALLAVVTQPFEEHAGLARYAEPAPASFAGYVTFCGT